MNNLIEYINGIDLGKTIAEQDYVDQYTYNLQNMYLHQMEYIRANYSELMNKINEYYDSLGYINNWYTEETQNPVDRYLNNISLDITINSQSIVDNYLNQLTNLMNQLEYRLANYEEVNGIIEQYENSEGYQKNWYTISSKQSVDDYISNIDRSITIDNQNIVDGYAVELSNRISQLEMKFHKPTVSGSISMLFGYQNGSIHNGVDIRVPLNTPVYAVADGVVYTTTINQTDGKQVIIYHNIEGQTYTSIYSHLANFNVSSGQVVTKDTIIGYAGNTGSSTAVHLHLTIARGRLYTDYQFNALNNYLLNPSNLMPFPNLNESYTER